MTPHTLTDKVVLITGARAWASLVADVITDFDRIDVLVNNAGVHRKAPLIVNVAYTAALRGFAGALPYSSSKWGLRGASRSAALELAPFGIRVEIANMVASLAGDASSNCTGAEFVVDGGATA
jgi:3alpha(or 20beta)-hydroxysteroid dehydrogenase